MSQKQLLPGEQYPLPMRVGGAPITADEALGVLRRKHRVAARNPKCTVTIPDQLPDDGETAAFNFRLPARLMAHVNARAEMERESLTSVVKRLLTAYAEGSPGTPVVEQPREDL